MARVQPDSADIVEIMYKEPQHSNHQVCTDSLKRIRLSSSLAK
jgi:hypothetical protein